VPDRLLVQLKSFIVLLPFKISDCEPKSIADHAAVYPTEYALSGNGLSERVSEYAEYRSFQCDLGIETILKLFSSEGLTSLFAQLAITQPATLAK
jgi:hypothetical protein